MGNRKSVVSCPYSVLCRTRCQETLCPILIRPVFEGEHLSLYGRGQFSPGQELSLKMVAERLVAALCKPFFGAFFTISTFVESAWHLTFSCHSSIGDSYRSSLMHRRRAHLEVFQRTNFVLEDPAIEPIRMLPVEIQRAIFSIFSGEFYDTDESVESKTETVFATGRQ